MRPNSMLSRGSVLASNGEGYPPRNGRGTCLPPGGVRRAIAFRLRRFTRSMGAYCAYEDRSRIDVERTFERLFE